MIYSELYERLQPIINAIDSTIIANSVLVNGNEITVATCNTLWLKSGYAFDVNGVIATVKSVKINENIVLDYNGILPMQFKIYPPKFYHGTVTATNAEININLHSENDITPMIYLHEVVRENYNSVATERIGVTSNNVRLLFLAQCNLIDWSTNNHYEYAIKPMRNLANAFLLSLNKANSVGKLSRYESIAHAHVGIYDSKGHSANLFNKNLSGIELVLDIPFIKENNCKC
jgi:hypothetical protein